MIVHRAFRERGQDFWKIECFDREYQIAYTLDNLEFVDRKNAEIYIRHSIYKDNTEPYDFGESGDWIIPNGVI